MITDICCYKRCLCFIFQNFVSVSQESMAVNSDPICNAMEYGSVSSDYPNSPFSWSRCACNIILEWPPSGQISPESEIGQTVWTKGPFTNTCWGGALKFFTLGRGALKKINTNFVVKIEFYMLLYGVDHYFFEYSGRDFQGAYIEDKI